MTWAKLDTAAVARALAAVAAEPGDLAEVYFERRIDAEWPPDEASCGLRLRREEGLAVRLARGHQTWLASRDAITGADLVGALRQVARAQPATMLEPDLAVGPQPAIPVASLRGFHAELERAIRKHHVAFPFRLTTRWHRRDLQVVGPRWVPEPEREHFYSLDVELPWGRFGALATALQADEAEVLARALVARFRAREAPPPPSGRRVLLLSPAATAVMLHEAVGHALEADLLAEGDLFRGRSGLDRGERSAADNSGRGTPGSGESSLTLDVLDDPRRAPRGVDRATDDEGQPVVRRWLIRDGRVDQAIADAQHAARSEWMLPGSGFRGGRHQLPLPRTVHLELLPGGADQAVLLRAAEGGLYVPEIDQGRLDPRTGEVVLHAPCGRFVRDGELAESCGPFRLRSSVPELLQAVRAVGADAQAAGAGWCAKGGQRRAVWATAPSLVLAALEISGGRSGR
ncbi:MAG: metallopeptidase TldD-related protein [Thermoanaerobaculia bacterium]